ncbi:hypothetical protein O181_024618 [Austropuccinia psidii MF-1]|uniref:Uncharacterized protein n=1 Tax=Austropuccinia psidii MF-1 TaxID=1389203 RepID=A0A9Q3CL44_9BASI|nr:hypothetical protein [Austropuccinia psidii MF-1]
MASRLYLLPAICDPPISNFSPASLFRRLHLLQHPSSSLGIVKQNFSCFYLNPTSGKLIRSCNIEGCKVPSRNEFVLEEGHRSLKKARLDAEKRKIRGNVKSTVTKKFVENEATLQRTPFSQPVSADNSKDKSKIIPIKTSAKAKGKEKKSAKPKRKKKTFRNINELYKGKKTSKRYSHQSMSLDKYSNELVTEESSSIESTIPKKVFPNRNEKLLEKNINKDGLALELQSLTQYQRDKIFAWLSLIVKSGESEDWNNILTRKSQLELILSKLEINSKGDLEVLSKTFKIFADLHHYLLSFNKKFLLIFDGSISDDLLKKEQMKLSEFLCTQLSPIKERPEVGINSSEISQVPNSHPTKNIEDLIKECFSDSGSASSWKIHEFHFKAPLYFIEKQKIIQSETSIFILIDYYKRYNLVKWKALFQTDEEFIKFSILWADRKQTKRYETWIESLREEREKLLLFPWKEDLIASETRLEPLRKLLFEKDSIRHANLNCYQFANEFVTTFRGTQSKFQPFQKEKENQDFLNQIEPKSYTFFGSHLNLCSAEEDGGREEKIHQMVQELFPTTSNSVRLFGTFVEKETNEKAEALRSLLRALWNLNGRLLKLISPIITQDTYEQSQIHIQEWVSQKAIEIRDYLKSLDDSTKNQPLMPLTLGSLFFWLLFSSENEKFENFALTKELKAKISLELMSFYHDGVKIAHDTYISRNSKQWVIMLEKEVEKFKKYSLIKK